MQDTLKFYNRIEKWILEQQKICNKECLIVGINAPQGAGKTTLTRHLVQAFRQANLSALQLSIDDFYLTHNEQLKLAQINSQNLYLQQRGYPGTHDIELGINIIEKIKSLHGQSMKIPRYDKSAHSGQGDRVPSTQWELLQGPIKILLFEGWMLGFSTPKTPPPTSEWKKIDSCLPKYQPWIEALDAFIYLKAENLNYVVDWRIEAEENMKAQGKSGMSVEKMRAYVDKFIPAYLRYSDTIQQEKLNIPFLELTIGKNRLPIK
ncbi:MAG: hypothetical protein KDD40_04955 [Bdellovibrionales bacterium]|nr:hypothetical protein [Bdellovibrionales bacterium]